MGNNMDKIKNIWLKELLQMIKAPTYFAYWLALFLVYFHQYLMEIYANKTAMVEAADSFAYAAARRFGDSFGAFLVIFPAFVIATSLLRDLRVKKLKQIEVRTGETVLAAVGVRYITQVCILVRVRLKRLQRLSVRPEQMALSVMMNSLRHR